MAEVVIRTATLDDCAAIVAIHTSHVTRWQRMTADGRGVDVGYDTLSIYERYLHGGPWMSVETCAVHLTHLLSGAGVPLVAELDGQVLAEAEVYRSEEPPPFGDHLNISILYVHAGYLGQKLGSALMPHILQLGKTLGCRRVCVAHAEAEGFYEQFGLRHTFTGQGMSFPARTGQVFYQAAPHLDPDPAQVRGWMMPLGRYQSAHQQWVTLWPSLWAGVPSLQRQRTERLKFQMAAATFFVLYQESRYDPRRASVYLWTPTAPTGPMLTAIGDKAHKLGFRRLDTFVLGNQTAILGPDSEADGYTQKHYSIDLD